MENLLLLRYAKKRGEVHEIHKKTWKYYFGQPELSKRNEGELRVHFLDVGQGDSALVELPDGKILLVDGGDDLESTSTTIMRYLKALKVNTWYFIQNAVGFINTIKVL